MAEITLGGKPVTTNGELPAVGSAAPDFVLVNSELKDVSLADFAGKQKILNIVASVDTDVCAASARKFDAEVKERDDLEVLIISADLPFAMSRFGKDENISSVQFLSMMRNRNFAKDYGVLLQDGPLAGVCARAVVVIDENNKVVYTQLVPEITTQPDYAQALAAAS